MINLTHLKVLLIKDFITLWRSKGFLIAFILLPVVLMESFTFIKNLVDKGEQSGHLINDFFRYTSTLQPNKSLKFYDYDYLDNNTNQLFISTLNLGCSRMNTAKYFYSKIAIVSNDTTLANLVKKYFQDYVIINQNLTQWETLKPFVVEVFDNVNDVFQTISNDDDQPYCFVLNFKKMDTDNDQYDIEYSFDGYRLPNTLLPPHDLKAKSPDLKSWDEWFNTGSVVLFPYINEFIARYKNYQKDYNSYKLLSSQPLYYQQMGYTPMKTNSYKKISSVGIDQLSFSYPFFLMIIFKIPFFYITSKIASEKESKSKEGMKMMGLKDSTYYLAWFILFFIISSVTSLIVSLITCLQLFKNLDFFLLFMFFLFYSQTLLGISFIVVAFLPNKRSSAIAAVLFNFISFFLTIILKDPATPESYQYFLSVFPNVCMNQIVKQMFYQSYQADGLNSKTFFNVHQGYSFGIGFIQILFEAIFLILLGLYLEQIVPSQYGVAKPWNFICKRKKKVYNQELNENYYENLSQKNELNFETVPDNLKKQEEDDQKQCLQIKNLVKKFGDKIAVKGTNMTMYNGQIFALLGHNGAGKTTTLSMLTGLLQPSSGKAEVFGIDIFQDMDEFRKILGVCPQHDVLFEMLTAEEHLRLFASFKGTEQDQIEGMVSQMIKDISLDTGKNQLSKTFSGGQKRKLSVAIAMIGNSKIVLLDEPSSGMDTTARRRMWEMLKKNKAGKIIILTTHFMDEADILGDRIAIMAEGDVQCCGSSLFLKNRYGVGYNLKIDKKSRDAAPDIDKFIFDRIQNAIKMQEVSSEIIYQLPTESSPIFKEFFKELDSNLYALGVRSYGVGITTLEEVFLKIGHGEEVNQVGDESIIIQNSNSFIKPINNSQQESTIQSDLENSSIESLIEDKNQFLTQLFILIKKKLLMQIRDRKSLAVDTLFPIFLILIGLKLATVAFISSQGPRLMTPEFLPVNLLYYNSQSKILNDPKKIQNFIENYFIPPFQNKFRSDQQVAIIFDKYHNNLTLQINQLDDFIFDLSEDLRVPFYAQMYVQSLNDPQNGYSGILLLNSTSQDVAGIYSAYGHTAFLKQYLKDSGAKMNNNFSVNYTNAPFPITKEAKAYVQAQSGSTSAILIAIAWLMVSDSLIQNIIKERQRNIKHQILISGSSLKAYWLSHYICDIIFQAILSIIAIIGLNVFDIKVEQVYVLFILMIFANPAFIYFLSFLTEKEETGSLVVKMIYFVIGIICSITVTILQVVNKDTAKIGLWLRWIFYPFPIYSLTFGYMNICNTEVITIQSELKYKPQTFDINIAGPSFYFLILQIFFFWAMVLMFELKVFDSICGKKQSKVKQKQNEIQISDNKSLLQKNFLMDQKFNYGDDMAIESQRIEQISDNIPVKVSHIKKNFGNKAAVKDVSFGLDFGECFALLGVSGAGKSTCFKCLTGEMYPSEGDVSVFGFNITTSEGFQQARKMIGYCPQFDAIFDGLTVREHLEIYASIKGIKQELKKSVIDRQIKEMDLQDFEHAKAFNLSGGNKRKLSVSMAMIGNPPLILLDEPSTGVDPQAKRFMWNVVSKICTLKKKSAVIITTHSMEEAEALCTKMGIMVAGQFKCFGSSTYIKDKYGTGYEIEIKIKPIQDEEILKSIQIAQQQNLIPFNRQNLEKFLRLQDCEYLISEIRENGAGEDFFNALKQNKQINEKEFIRWQIVENYGDRVIIFLETQFKELRILEHYGTFWKIKVSRDDFSIGYLFGLMEDIKDKSNISEYSVAQTTLDQIFNNFATQAEQDAKGLRRQSSRRKTYHDNSRKTVLIRKDS